MLKTTCAIGILAATVMVGTPRAATLPRTAEVQSAPAQQATTDPRAFSLGLDVTDFCCPDYLKDISQRISDKWNKNIPERGEATLRFVLTRDGSVTEITTDKATSQRLDDQSREALTLARLLPLPAAFNSDHLVIHVRFPYGN